MKLISTVMICLLVVVNPAIEKPLQDVPESNPDQTGDEEAATRAAISDNGWILKVPHVRSIKMFHALDEATRQTEPEILVIVDISANVTKVERQLPSALDGVPLVVVSQQQSSQVQQRADRDAEGDACWAAVDSHQNELTKPHVYSSNEAESDKVFTSQSTSIKPRMSALLNKKCRRKSMDFQSLSTQYRQISNML